MTDFDLKDFTPYLLNLAAETSSMGFQAYYKDHYGMLRTEWRVLFHLGRYGPLTAKEICTRTRIHKTKVSRAVSALETKRYLVRQEQDQDRRLETLSLTAGGQQVFRDLYKEAARYEHEIMSRFTAQERRILHKCLSQIAEL